MPWWAILLAVLYGIGWLTFVFLEKPRDAFEGTILLTTGLVWPVHALGWLVSRPFR